VNLSRIESRPSRGKAWQYVFSTDVDGHRSDPPIARAIDELAVRCDMVKVLGSYPRDRADRRGADDTP
jgi:chorismate mutase/prephenate dehydratase